VPKEECSDVVKNRSPSLLLLVTEVPRFLEDRSLGGRVLGEVEQQCEALGHQSG